jgi:hypothetical protein
MRWSLEPKDLRINLDEDVYIECKADGEPRPKISWITAKGFNINFWIIVHSLIFFKGVKFDGEKLFINSLITKNVEKFTCISDNGVEDPLKKEIEIVVNG